MELETGALRTMAASIHENALLMIETQQGNDPVVGRIYEAARELIEMHLRSE